MHCLTRNARLALVAEEFAIYLVRVGDGAAAIIDGDATIEIPPNFRPDAVGVADTFEYIGRQVIPEIETRFCDERYLLEGDVLATKNEDVGRINSAVLGISHGASFGLQCADIVLRGGGECLYPSGRSDSLGISGIPPHVLRLEIGMPVMLLRNHNPHRGLRNDANAVVRAICPACVEIELFTGKFAIAREFIQRPRPERPTQTSSLL